jgi:hypothetical protein
MRSAFESKSANSDTVQQRILMQLLIEVAEGHKNDRDLSSFFPSARLVEARNRQTRRSCPKVQRTDLYACERDCRTDPYSALSQMLALPSPRRR